uniref:F-box domain-containing protein n=1 Tax=Leersia perrieri TaxID=77586 RepID=A0A0D9WWK1_9ORYZ
MASSKLWEAPCSSGANLPLDVLFFEVLLCLPAKELCRLRAVCRSWNAITRDSMFTKAHASRHTDPLFVVTFWEGKNSWDCDANLGVSIMDMSGNVVKRIPIGKVIYWINLLPTRLDLVCLDIPGKGIGILNPSSGKSEMLPRCHNGYTRPRTRAGETHAFGLVASTGQYKMVRIVHLDHHFHNPSLHLCEVITLAKNYDKTWRRKRCAPVIVSPGHTSRRGGFMKNVVLDGIVYFMMDAGTTEPAGLVPFNLETEKWMATIPGPGSLHNLVGYEQPYRNYFELNQALSVANLRSCLVTVHNVRHSSVDLWFLRDVKTGLWVKTYSVSIQYDGLYSHNESYPLLVLNDGRIVFYKRQYEDTSKPQMHLLQSYDPETNGYTNLFEIKNVCSSCVGIYTGNLLSSKSDSC